MDEERDSAGLEGGVLLASDHAYAVLRRDILLGVFAPGAALRFADLRARYDIGGSPLREALFRLSSEQLVVQEVNRGFRVPPLSQGEWADVVAMRRKLEPGAARAAVERGGEGWEEALMVAHLRLGRVGPAQEIVTPLGDVARSAKWETCHRAFHAALIAGCGSDWTIRIVGLLSDQFDRYRRFAQPGRGVQAALAAQHDEMLAAALARDGAGVERVLDAHVAMTGEAVGAALARLV
jgi:DNA-binding GntR family transcriptional regulator